MKKRTKIGFSLGAVVLGAIALSSCTQSFCSQVDTARMKYAFEPGISRIEAGGSETLTFIGDNGNQYVIQNAFYNVADWETTGATSHIGRFVYNLETLFEEKLNYLNSIISKSRSAGYVTIDETSVEYLTRFDFLAFNEILGTAADRNDGDITLDLTNEEDLAKLNRDISYYSYLRFAESNYGSAWKNWNFFDEQARKAVVAGDVLERRPASLSVNNNSLPSEYCPSSDFIKYYKSTVNGYVAAYRTCLTTKTDKYGSYGYNADGVFMNKKTWGDAWSKGLFEGLLVYPIGWLIDSLVIGFKGTGVSSGIAAFLAIVFVTFIIRTIMLLATYKQTQGNTKMTELQPEIQKIQNKYPNSNTSQVEKQRMAEEMNRLYKKNKINPFTTIIVLIIQFPVFICVWGALSGSAALTNGTILGLNLSMTIKDVLFNKAMWTAAHSYAGVTALMLFLLMAVAQAVSMLLPQWIQKKKAKDVAKLGKNPAQKSQNNKMKWFTYIMLAMIIFMGFSLASAMGIYWFIGAIFSIVQTVVMQILADRRKKKKQN